MGGSTSGGQYGTFATSKSGNKKTVHILVTALIAVIFVLVIGVIFFNNSKKPKSQAVAETSAVDLIPGWWYQQYFGSSVCEKESCKPDADPDNDNLTNSQEYYYHSNPLNPYTVKDAMSDGELVANNFDPSKPGKVTFEEALSDDYIMGESLLFNSDITQLINESIDPNAVELPTVNEVELNVSDDNTREAMLAYADANKIIIAKYFSANAASYIEGVASSPDSESVAEVKARSLQATSEMKALAVPSEFLQIHKYSIMLLTLLPDVINVPDQEALGNEYNAEGNAWFDKTQAMMSVYQKMDLESKRLENKFK